LKGIEGDKIPISLACLYILRPSLGARKLKVTEQGFVWQYGIEGEGIQSILLIKKVRVAVVYSVCSLSLEKHL
jgi:hypothetical protein